MDEIDYEALGFQFVDLGNQSPAQIVSLCEGGHETWKNTYLTSKGHIKTVDYLEAKIQLGKNKQHTKGRKRKYDWPKYVEYLIDGALLMDIRNHDALISHANEKYAEKYTEILNAPRTKQYALAVLRAFKRASNISN